MELAGVDAGELSRERLQGIALATRKAKNYGVDAAGWQQDARARAAERGLGDRELRRLTSAIADGDRGSQVVDRGLGAVLLPTAVSLELGRDWERSSRSPTR